MVAAVIGLTGYAAFLGSGDKSASLPASGTPLPGPPASATTTATPVPVSTYSIPATWSEPARWLAAPRGTRTVHGHEVGFPHTTDGAIGMLLASSTYNVEGATTTVDEQLTTYFTYTAESDRTPTREQRVRQGAAKADAQVRASMGAPESGPLPSGTWVRTHLVGFKIVQARPDSVTAHVLLRTCQKAGETKSESVVYTVGTIAVAWLDEDWKLDVTGGASASPGPVPEIAAPGDAAFNVQGWTAIRQAS